MSSIEADGLLRLMNQQHQQNRGDIDTLKVGQERLGKEMTSLTSEISGGVKVLKFIGWTILAMFAGLTVWFASLEVRGKLSDNKPLPGVSSSQKPPADAGLPYALPR
jgi:hypothetical protein